MLKTGRLRVGDIIDDHTPNAFKGNKRVVLPMQLADSKPFWLGPAIIAALVKLILILSRIEEIGQNLGGNLFKIVTTVKKQLAAGGPGRK